MKYLRYILLYTLSLLTASCADFNLNTEKYVPVITSLFSEAGTNSAILTSSISSTSTKVQCGFYVGRDKNTLTQYKCDVEGNEFSLEVEDLEAGSTYWFKAYVTNGINEICTSLQHFETLEIQEFDVNFKGGISIDTEKNETLIELKVRLEGDCTPIKNMWFAIVASSGNHTSKINAEISGNIMSGYAKKPDTGKYSVIAYISDGHNTKQSVAAKFEIEEPTSPAPPEYESFEAEVGNISIEQKEELINLKAIVSGDIKSVKERWFCIGSTPYDLYVKINAESKGQEINGTMSKPSPGKYWAKACISDGKITHESELIPFEIKVPPTPVLPEPPEPGIKFSAEISDISAKKTGDMMEFTALLTGNTATITEGYFYIGLSEGHMLRISTGKIDMNRMTGYTIGLAPGKYKFKASISNGIEIKETPLKELVIN